ncbi:hypothetical protein [Mesorhizobium sp. BE184]|uniref:structural cement protein Gp24 n=1 Tax=Mesorhizobium sp. BE184 TaxID=2817714 RepID=UPI00285E8EE1|nr:hypothetical protein [Mesorhizobium sp. BE184]MDR7032945.1 hypothetical protein [Mesorhizobium sp. BE184]
MPMTFSQSIAAYALGRRANMEEWNAITRTNSGATAIPFGVPVVPGSGAHTCVILTATAQNILGISEASQVQAHVGDNHAQYENVPICTMGVIGVLLGADVTEGAQARFNLSNGTWTSAAQSATVATIPGAQFAEAGSSGSIGVVRYVRPVPSLSVAS